jgi:predicted transcriptional regulator
VVSCTNATHTPSTKQSLIARLEAGEQNTTIKTLNRIAKATNTRLHISFLTQD